MAVDPSTYADNDQVGSVFEVGINGEGYVLADTPERPYRSQRGTLEAARLATSDTPFNEAIERYTFVGHSDWSGGAGQRLRDRDDASDDKFWDSENINPFDDDGGIRLLNQMAQDSAPTAYNGLVPRLVRAGDTLYYVGATNNINYTTLAANGTFSIAAASSIACMASDGSNWYAMDGDDIYQGSSAADPGAAWVTIAGSPGAGIAMCWALDRLAVTYTASGRIVVSTISDAGAEEVSGGRFSYDDSAQIPAMTAGDGYLWWVVNRADRSEIHYWQIGSADTYAAIGLTLPAGQRGYALGFYLGNVFLRTVERLGSTQTVTIYQCIPAEGRLTPVRVASWTQTGDTATQLVGGFAGDDRYVYFTWNEMTEDDYAGVGCIDLSTGGYVKWVHTGAERDLFDVAMLDDKIVVLGIDGSSNPYVYDEQLDTPRTSGWLKTSISDQRSTLDKYLSDITAMFDPLPADATVAVSYTDDYGTTYTSAGTAASVDDDTDETWDVGVTLRSHGLKIDLVASATSPVVNIVQSKIHPLPPSDELLQIPINCGSTITGLNGTVINQSTSGIALARQLQALVGTRCKLQDVDWPTTATPTYWDVVGADYIGTKHVYNQHLNRLEAAGVCVMTLRRPTS